MNEYLCSTPVIDWEHPAVLAQAQALGAGGAPLDIARRCFEWVRDEIKHSVDYQLNPVTCTASEVLESGTGFCYAKSHLLAALLRANGIPAGLCYQRFVDDEAAGTYCLHGLNAIYLREYGWYRVDARGNKATVDAQFTPPVEQLAFPVLAENETDLPGLWADPLPQVVDALRGATTWDGLVRCLPDVDPTRLQAQVRMTQKTTL